MSISISDINRSSVLSFISQSNPTTHKVRENPLCDFKVWYPEMDKS